MAQSTYVVQKADLDKHIGHFLGYGTTYASMSSDEKDDVDISRDNGVSRFYSAHDWVFLLKAATLSFTADDYSYDLPDDFGYIRHDVYFNNDDSYYMLKHINVGYWRNLMAQSDTGSVPKYYTIQPKSGYTGAAGMTYELYCYPPPDQAYTMNYWYRPQFDKLTDSLTYPAGGAMFRNVMLAACIAEAANYKDDEPLGPHEDRYMKLLAEAKRLNAKLSPRYLGAMQDRSIRKQIPYQDFNVLVNGVLPS
jgi:hypothetical protein